MDGAKVAPANAWMAGTFLMVALPISSVVSGQQTPRVGISGNNLSKMAVHTVLPTYPKPSLQARREGVVVAQVLVGPDGKMRTVDVLQAPHEEIGRATRDALMQWTFRTTLRTPDGKPTNIRSKLIFYFTIKDGKGLVLTPQQMTESRRTEERTAADGVVPESYPTIDMVEWERRAKTIRPILLDIRDRAAYARGHLQDATNIPEAELSTRAGPELSRLRQIVVDCPRETSDLCTFVARILQRGGFSNVALLARN